MTNRKVLVALVVLVRVDALWLGFLEGHQPREFARAHCYFDACLERHSAPGK